MKCGQCSNIQTEGSIIKIIHQDTELVDSTGHHEMIILVNGSLHRIIFSYNHYVAQFLTFGMVHG